MDGLLLFQVKRKDILDLSREFDLTGFCLPGKPGIICVEGMSRNTDDWWQKVSCILLLFLVIFQLLQSLMMEEFNYGLKFKLSLA